MKKKESINIDGYYCDSCIKENPTLHIVYKSLPPSVPPSPPEKKNTSIKHEPLEERKQDKKASDKNVSTTSALIKFKPTKTIGKSQAPKVSQSKKKVNQKSKSKSNTDSLKQCSNPECIYAAKQGSKYCSPDCGYEFAKARYETHFIPNYTVLQGNHSQARLQKMKDLDQLEKDRGELEQCIKNLKMEKAETEQNIKIIKEQAKKSQTENENSKENDDDDDEMDNDDGEITSGDASKTYCVTCSGPLLAENVFRHWFTCHKKHEDLYNFTADVIFKHSYCEDDPDPKLYCHQQDKKSKRYCMNLECACPQHTNWLSDKDEVCGCPLKIMQKLVPDGNYCLELKKDCTQHYHWDKFRLAQINVERVQAFTKLDVVNDQIMKVRRNLEDTYGGVVGVMLHNTTV